MEDEYEQNEESKRTETENNLSKEEYIFLSQVYEKAKYTDGMLKEIKKGIEKDNKLTKEERRLFSTAYGNKISKIRRNLRYINHEYKKLLTSNPEGTQCKILEQLKNTMITEILEICEEVEKIIDEKLLPVLDDNQNEEKIFYFKMKADYKRYLCELIPDDSNQEIVEETNNFYSQAYQAAEMLLPISSSLRLGIILNYSVFLKEIKKDNENALKYLILIYEQIAPKYEELINEQEIDKEAICIIKMIDTNIKGWQNDININEE